MKRSMPATPGRNWKIRESGGRWCRPPVSVSNEAPCARIAAQACLTYDSTNDREKSMASLSRQLARWVVGLRYEDLPPAVVDRAKGVTLQGLASVLLGSQTPEGRQAVALMTGEEAGVRTGATIMVDGTRVTRGGAAFANAEMAFAGGKWDTFRMLSHPGTSIIPGAFVAAETAGASGRDFITGVAA